MGDGLSDLCRDGVHRGCRLCACLCHPQNPIPPARFWVGWTFIACFVIGFWGLVLAGLVHAMP